jgi:hypothetical protein
VEGLASFSGARGLTLGASVVTERHGMEGAGKCLRTRRRCGSVCDVVQSPVHRGCDPGFPNVNVLAGGPGSLAER